MTAMTVCVCFLCSDHHTVSVPRMGFVFGGLEMMWRISSDYVDSGMLATPIAS